MSDKSDASFQKARDEAIRALVSGGLTPEQVSALKLSEVHLSTNTLVMELDEFDTSASARERPISLKLDAKLQRTLISWLVVRPDGPNDHLFPGAGTAGLDVESINKVVAAEKQAKAPASTEPVDTDEATPSESEGTGISPESVPPRPPRVEREGVPPPPPPPVTPRREEPEAVSLDEIETLRKRLAESYDAWGPAVTAAMGRRVVESSPTEGVHPSPPVETEPPPDVVDSGAPSEPPPQEVRAIPVVTPERGPEPVEPPPASPQETMVAGSVPEPAEHALVPAPVSPPSAGLGARLKGWWQSSGEKVTLNLSYRSVVLGGLTLLVIVCCVGSAFAGGALLGLGPADFLAGATPTETQTPTQTVPPATLTLSPTPTATVTSTPTATTIATTTATPAPTSTQVPIPTPAVIVVTATPTPEPPATDTPVPTDTPEGGVPPEPTVTETPGFKYPAPVLIWPEDGSTVPGVINILQWELVGPLDDDEWYAVRLVYREQGELVYAGDRVKIPEWRVPDRLYYRADGPDLEYSWYVFVERDNSDGSTTQLSPDSETFVFRWE
jgi:hypothetical protein